MNKLLTDIEGQQINDYDYAFMQESYKDAINAITKSLKIKDTETNFRLEGASWTVQDPETASPILIVYAGYIYVDGEIYKVNQSYTALSANTSIADVETQYEWDLKVTYDTRGFKLFFDAVTRDCYEIREAIFTNTPTTWSNVKDLLSFKNMLDTLIDNSITDYTSGTYTKYLEIGTFDLSVVSPSKIISLVGTTTYDKIRSVNIVLYPDATPTLLTPVLTVGQSWGTFTIYEESISIFGAQLASGYSTLPNRGFIKIDYIN